MRPLLICTSLNSKLEEIYLSKIKFLQLLPVLARRLLRVVRGRGPRVSGLARRLRRREPGRGPVDDASVMGPVRVTGLRD